MIEEQNPDVEAGTVFSQSPEAYAYADPDMPMTIKVSTGDQPPVTPTPEVEAQPTVAADGKHGNVRSPWIRRMGIKGGAVRLELVQTVNGMPEASTVLENQTLTFPYKLDITGCPASQREPSIFPSRLTEHTRNWDIIPLPSKRSSSSCREKL